MIAAHKNKVELEHSFEELKVRKPSEGFSPIQSVPENTRRLSSETACKFPDATRLSVDKRRFSGDPPALLDYENVSVMLQKGNYENVLLNPLEQEKHI